MKKLLLLIPIFSMLSYSLMAQEDLVYQKPPKEILELADFERAPSLMMDNKRTKMLFAYRDTYKTLAQLSEKEMRLAGLRINPVTNISSTVRYNNNLKYKLFNEIEAKQVQGLPQNPQSSNMSWSPEERNVAFTNTKVDGTEFW